MEGFKKKKHIRAGHKAYMRKLLNEANLVVKEEPIQAVIDRLQRLKISLNERLGVIGKLDEEILDLIEEEEEIAPEIETAGKFREEVYGMLVQIDGGLLAGKMQNTAGHVNSNFISQPSPTVKSSRLPKLSLKKFGGDAKDWHSFWDSFKNAVHENSGLSSIERFNYLKSLLEGSAATTIQALPLTEVNYQAAVDLLNQRFGNKQVIISSHMDGLLSLPVLTYADLKTLRKTFDKMEAHVRGLEALDVPTETYGSLLVPVLMSKIPEDIRLLLGREVKEGEWKLTKVLDLLREEIENRERCSGIQALRSPDRKQPPSNSGNKHYPTGAALLAAPTAGRDYRVVCTFCKQDHPTYKCNIVTNVEARRDIIRREGRCFICLKTNHRAFECGGKTCFKCEGRHHTSICFGKKMESRNKKSESPGLPNTNSAGAPKAKQTVEQGCQTNTLHVASKDSVLLQTAQAVINGERVRLIFDSGSQKSYITEGIKSKAQLRTVGWEPLLINAFGNATKGQPGSYECAQFTVENGKGSMATEMRAFVVPNICAPLGSQEINRAQEQFEFLHNLELADDNNGEDIDIDLLIGADNMWRFFTGDIKRNEDGCGPIASETNLGWVLSGPLRTEINGEDRLLSSVNLVATHVLNLVALKPDTGNVNAGSVFTGNESAGSVNVDDEMLSQLWNLESIGIRDSETVQQAFQKNITFEKGRYHVVLPVKEKHELLPDNYELSLARLDGLVKRLRKEPEVLKEYDHTIQEQESKGIIEKLEDSDSNTVPGEVHYLPHQAVIRRDAETTKLRVVFDASSKAKASLPSLNDCIHTGPSLNSEIFDILIRFRRFKTGLVADIEKAFLNIAVTEEQRDLMRFLWIENADDEDPKVEVYRFCRVIFGMNCSPFLLNGTLHHHVSNYYPENPDLAKRILSGLYVDDLSSGEEGEDETYRLYKEVKVCFAAGNFNLRKWASNNEELNKRIIEEEAIDTPTVTQQVTQEDESYAKIAVGRLEEAETTKERKVLGTNWNLSEDKFVLKLGKVTEFAEGLELTKRNVLRVAAKFFDPLGFVSPIMLNFKLLLQELFADKFEWDCVLPDTRTKHLQKWLRDIKETQEISMDRYYFTEQGRRVTSAVLHGFGDASKKAYSAVVYLRYETNDGFATRFVVSKSRVAPLKPMSIPRLELVAAWILARLTAAVKEALAPVLQIERIHYWTDSRVVLYWIQSGKDYKQFVQNRVNEIMKLTNGRDWGHCPGTENPADIGSRGCLASELEQNELWWQGPRWLREAEENYPKADKTDSTPELPAECTQEIRSAVFASTAKTIDSIEVGRLSCLIDCQRYSSCLKLFRVTATVRRFVHNCRAKLHGKQSEVIEGSLLATEIKDAENAWVKELQSDMEAKSTYKDLESQLGLYKDDNNIIRSRGRLGNAELSDDAKHPVLLPGEGYITKLIVRACHERTFHGGVKDTLTELRTKYWIPKGRQSIKKVLHKCVTCKRLEGISFKPPAPADLPGDRVKETLAFTHVGVDFAGPLFVRTDNKEKGMTKVYICLFTCATSRGLHLEITPDLSVAAFMRALRRFIARRGMPTSITSDNAKTFKRANKDIGKLFRHPAVAEYTANKGISWKFILERAPWWGGFYERMVQLVKRRLRKLLGNARLSYEELLTVVTEVEGVLNSRPITYVYSDVSDDEPLTPSHLILGRRASSLPDPSESSDNEDSGAASQRRADYLNRLLKQFWQRWSKEYLRELRERHQCGTDKGQDRRKLAVGEIVIVQDDGLPRSKWRVAEVTELLQSRDGEVRGATLRVVSQKGKDSALRRPLQKLYPLEITVADGQRARPRQANPQPVIVADRPPRRTAAANAADAIRRLTVDQAV